jgi:hypothetical protein
MQRSHIARRHADQDLAVADAYQHRTLARAERQLRQHFQIGTAAAAAEGAHTPRQPRRREHRGQHDDQRRMTRSSRPAEAGTACCTGARTELPQQRHTARDSPRQASSAIPATTGRNAWRSFGQWRSPEGSSVKLTTPAIRSNTHASEHALRLSGYAGLKCADPGRCEADHIAHLMPDIWRSAICRRPTTDGCYLSRAGASASTKWTIDRCAPHDLQPVHEGKLC